VCKKWNDYAHEPCTGSIEAFDTPLSNRPRFALDFQSFDLVTLWHPNVKDEGLRVFRHRFSRSRNRSAATDLVTLDWKSLNLLIQLKSLFTFRTSTHRR